MTGILNDRGDDFEELGSDPVEDTFPKALSDHDREILTEIRDIVWSWRTKARSAHDLLAIGALLTGLDAVLSGDEPGMVVRVGVSNATTPTDDEMEIDGQSIDIGLSDEGIQLCRTRYVPTGQGRSRDHQVEVLAILSPHGHLEQGSPARWISSARGMMSYSVAIEASIDALPDYS